MSEFHCRRKETRIRLVKQYEIIPILYATLLNGQKKRSAAEADITKEYYCFSYKKKGTNNKPETFFVGKPVAQEFLELLGHDPLPLFNIKKYHENIRKLKRGETFSSGKEKWDALALELYTIISIIIMAWEANMGILSKILIDTRKNKEKRPPLRDIKAVNTIIKSDHKNRTIYQMLDEFRKQDKIKDFDFPLVTKILSDLLLEGEIEKNYLTGNNT